METGFFFFIIHANPSVLTVPMRNGNLDIEVPEYEQNFGSYRTYEEWKLSILFSECDVRMVLTVPMRNGNLTY